MLRRVAWAVLLISAAPAVALAGCPAGVSRDDPACARPARAAIAACINDAIAIEACADRATGIAHALDLKRAASEYLKAGIAIGHRTARGRYYLAHATILDERVQDDPNAPATLREGARRDEERARALIAASPRKQVRHR
jgi:hypothetical protein